MCDRKVYAEVLGKNGTKLFHAVACEMGPLARRETLKFAVETSPLHALVYLDKKNIRRADGQVLWASEEHLN